MSIVKTDPTPLWGLSNSKDWFILCGEPPLLNIAKKVQHNDWELKGAGIGVADNKGSIQLKR